MKQIIMLLVVLLTVLQAQAQDLSELYAELSQSVVKVMVEGVEVSPKSGQMVASEGIGSGVLISEEGLILTASHVIQTANSIKVMFKDGEVIPAKVVSSAPFADVASIKLMWVPKNPKVANLGNSDSVKVGQRSFLIGSPFGLDYTLTVGHISGKHRQRRFTHGEEYMEFLQTDAAINHGNSGGPMFNLDGEVIGIASFILSESGGFNGIGFAATSNVCKRLLIDDPTPWSGIEAVFISGELADALNIPQSSGLLVQKVTLFSPLGIIGIQSGTIPFNYNGEDILLGGDVILGMNGIPYTSEANFERARKSIDELEPGEKFTLEVFRDGQRQKIKGKLE
ncbi:MAG: trypsin-like peptidase domain-containing protein [Reichenbachiella sp.]